LKNLIDEQVSYLEPFSKSILELRWFEKKRSGNKLKEQKEGKEGEKNNPLYSIYCSRLMRK
jgi:hypothetical protein